MLKSTCCNGLGVLIMSIACDLRPFTPPAAMRERPAKQHNKPDFAARPAIDSATRSLPDLRISGNWRAGNPDGLNQNSRKQSSCPIAKFIGVIAKFENHRLSAAVQASVS